LEVGLSDLPGTGILLKSGLARQCLRLLVEPMQPSVEEALRTLDGILSLLAGGGVSLPILFHGLNETAWRMIDEAASRGFDTRIGFEDILAMPDGSPAESNAVLVSEAVRRMAGKTR
jgi:hypothetical protein